MSCPTVEVPAHCRACDAPLRVRLEVGGHVAMVWILCDVCLGARVEAVRAGRDVVLREKISRQTLQTHCKRGHARTPENRTPRGACRLCHNAAVRAYKRRRTPQGDAA